MRARFADADPVLLDLDGTLTESGPGILASVRHALNRLDRPIPAEAELRRFIGPPLADSFRDVCGMDPATATRAISAYREFYAERGQYDNAVYDGIPALLEALRGAGRTLAVATSKAEVYARSIVSHFGLEGYFAHVVGSELDGRRTAKAEVIAEALVRLGRPASAAVMVGDRSHDVVGALTVGMDCIGVLWGYGDALELESAGACALAATAEELGDLLLDRSP